MITYSTPGAYYERADTGVPAVAPVRMDVAAFVGIARQGPLHTAVPVESYRQFVAYFGDVTPAGYLAYSVRAFFENGGRRCWVVRVSSSAASTASVDLPSLGGGSCWRVRAASPGVWGNDLDIEMRSAKRTATMTRPAESAPEYSAVAAVAGFVRGSHVRIVDPVGTEVFRVVSGVDALNGRLYWVNPESALRLPYDAPLGGLVPDAPLLVETVEYTLVVRKLRAVAGLYEHLSLIPENPRYGPAVLAPMNILASQPSTWKLPANPDQLVIEELRGASTIAALAPLDLAGPAVLPLSMGTVGADGLAGLRLEDFIGEPADALDSNELRAEKQRGLSALDDVAEVTTIAIPDINVQPELPPLHAPPPPCVVDPCLPPPPPGPAIAPLPAMGDVPPAFDDSAVYRVQSEMVGHCERHADRIALLDPPFRTVRDARLGTTEIRAWRKQFDSKYAALYFPWVLVVDPLRGGDRVTRTIPPCGHVAGYYAASDAAVGVHKAPANGALGWAQDLSIAVDDTTHGLLNDEQIDVLRALPGRDIRILGARTLSTDGQFRYVNVRRLLIMIEKAIHLAFRWAVFEPNDTSTRTKLHLSATSFLLSLWQQGRLVGKTPREAFFVRCDAETTNADARDRGELVVEIGVAPSVPYEFVVVRVGRTDNQFEMTETVNRRGMV